MKQWPHILLALSLALACPAAALAADEDSTESGSTTVAEESSSYEILAGETDIEKLTDAYEEARADLAVVDGQIAELQAQIDEIESELPVQQARSDAGLKQRYIMQSNPLVIVESLLSADTLGDFIKQSDYIEKVSHANLREYNRLRDMQSQLDQTRAEQERLREEADARAAETEAQLREVQDKRAQLQADDQAFAIMQAEIMGGPNSIEKPDGEDKDEKGDGASSSSSSSSSGSSSSSSASSNSKSSSSSKDDGASGASDADGEKKNAEPAVAQIEATLDTAGIEDGADWHADRDVFIEEWARRIDTFLKGSPLEGQGRNFASAAWKYGIDPRWSPAISHIESSKGAICIRPYNAWGWGAADSDPYGLALEWGSWEEAIDAHVKGLAQGYGYTVSMGRARTYCPPNWQRWYNSVLGDMGSM